ncbi:endonuclease/exonuclease/phosphatase family protein [Hymenobacter sp. GOD-10R]|uniref:endonuclease/exonuclease/phosphatase family protein n=1 Tax=Hymenobacter sp. GOD-10R TaxID=3093922 RepID=UPI002D7A26E4|nr:endonuclease/exonuclease/phosphatase family protein [Hymenobacter sp. GOD-10R]WRQ27258.1 endonuclease/exonuclease/phosphatase family protein [Hymenobacter sp. GOD-10R]
MSKLDFTWLLLARCLTLLVGVLALVATLLPLLRQQAWWIRVFDFPRLQIVGVSLGSALAAWLLGAHHWPAGVVLLALLVLASGYQLFRILPYTPLRPKQVADSTLSGSAARQREISLLVTNVLMTNRDAGRCLRVIQDYNPDIILAVETDQWWLDQLEGLKENYPYTALKPLPNTYGLLVFSRLELVDPHIRFLIDDDIPSFHSRVVLPSGELVRLHCLHPKPPAPAESKTSTRRDAELLLVGREIEYSDEPTIVAGDMNDVAWSHTSELFRRISGLLDPRIGRGLLPTFHADYSLLRWPLDHVFHSAHFKVKDIQRLPNVGSDHFPIFLRLSYEPQAKAEQEIHAEKPDQDDQEEMEEKIAQGFEEEAEEEREEQQASKQSPVSSVKSNA